MKTLLITPDFLPIRGGIQTYLSGICTNWPQDDLKVITYDFGNESEDDTRNYPVVRIPQPSKFSLSKLLHHRLYPRTWSFRKNWSVFGSAVQKEVKLGADALLLGHVTMALIGYYIKKHFNVDYYIIVYALEIANILRSPRSQDREYATKMLQNAAGIFSISAYTDDIVRNFDVPEEKICRLNFSMDKEFLDLVERPDPEVEKLYPGKKVILSVGRHVARKGFDTLIEAMPLVVEKVPDALCVLVGDGEYRPELEKLVKENKMEDYVNFVGSVKPASVEMVRQYRRCDLFAMLNRNIEDDGDTEGFGAVFIEAGACGKPVIGGNNGGVPDAIQHDRTGLLVDMPDKKVAADAIISILTNPELAKRLGDNGRKHVWEERSWAKTVDEMITYMKSTK